MNSTLDEGESFLRGQDDEHGGVEIGKDEVVQDDEDIPEIAPEAPDESTVPESLGPAVEFEQGTHLDDGEPPALDAAEHNTPRNGLANAPSLDDSLSTPDDTPSAPGSILSSPASDAGSIRSPARRGSPSIPHRPFDIRFQSRLSSSQLTPLRSSSPAFLGAHSRHSSTASIGLYTPSEPDEGVNPWDVIRWSKFKKITGQAFLRLGEGISEAQHVLAVADQMVLGNVQRHSSCLRPPPESQSHHRKWD